MLNLFFTILSSFFKVKSIDIIINFASIRIKLSSVLLVLTWNSSNGAPLTQLSSSYLLFNLLFEEAVVNGTTVIHVVVMVDRLFLLKLLLESGPSILRLQPVIALIVGIRATCGRLFKLFLAFHSLRNGFLSTISVVGNPSLV